MCRYTYRRFDRPWFGNTCERLIRIQQQYDLHRFPGISYQLRALSFFGEGDNLDR